MRDDWQKPRTRQQYLTGDDIRALRVAFNCGVKPRDVARSLQCASRTAFKYYSLFRLHIQVEARAA